MLHHCWYVCVPLYAIVVVASSITILSRSIVPISCRLNEIVSNEIVSIYLATKTTDRKTMKINQPKKIAESERDVWSGHTRRTALLPPARKLLHVCCTHSSTYLLQPIPRRFPQQEAISFFLGIMIRAYQYTHTSTFCFLRRSRTHLLAGICRRD